MKSEVKKKSFKYIPRQKLTKTQLNNVREEIQTICKEIGWIQFSSFEELADMLERKLYQQALGVVSDNIVHRKTERFTRIVKDEETGEEHELSEIRKSEWVDEAEGTTEGSVKAAEFLLKHLRPEVYGDKVELDTEIDTVVIVDDIGNKLNNSDGNMLFYDDSVDAPDGGSDDEQ